MIPENYIETHNRTALINAIKACPHDSCTTIKARHHHGYTTFKIGPANPPVGFFDAEAWFEKHLKILVRRVRNTAPDIWLGMHNFNLKGSTTGRWSGKQPNIKEVDRVR